MEKVSVSIFGNAGPWDEYNPLQVTSREGIKDLLFALSKNPSSCTVLSQLLSRPDYEVDEMLNSLLHINAIRKNNDKYFLRSPFYTVEDQRLMYKAVIPVAREIAEVIVSRIDEVKKIIQELSACNQVDQSVILFSVIGCYFLDWACLTEFHEKDILISAKPQPGDRKYVMQIRDPIDTNIDDILSRHYIGSISNRYAGHTFTSFGAQGYRYTFPNFFSYMKYSLDQAESKNWPSWSKDKLKLYNSLDRENTARSVVDILSSLTNGSMMVDVNHHTNDSASWNESIVNILLEMGYITEEKKEN